jgi:hypothetical protein
MLFAPDAAEKRGRRFIPVLSCDSLGRAARRGPQFDVGASRSITLWPVGELLALKAWIFRAEEPLVQAASPARDLNSNRAGTLLR